MATMESRFACEPWAQGKLCLLWLGGSLAAVFFGSMMIGPGGYGGALLAAMLVLPLLGFVCFVLLWTSGAKAWRLVFGPDRDVRVAVIVALLPFVTVAMLAGLALPAVWASGWIQPYGILLVNKFSYDGKIDAQERKPLPARDAILVWNWGGSPDSNLDIVWDPLDQPEQRVAAHEKATSTNCHRLLSHYYNCFVNY